jgi:cold shock CspA family protein
MRSLTVCIVPHESDNVYVFRLITTGDIAADVFLHSRVINDYGFRSLNQVKNF